MLQFLEDLSDRELERFICENAAARWFCQFDLTAKTPDHSVFGRVRSKIGTNKLSKIFSLLRDQLKAHGYMSEVFTFVDATHLISKVGLWKERDKAIELRLESLNNKTLEKVSADKDAKFGAKSKDKIWFTRKIFYFLTNELQTLRLLWLQAAYKCRYAIWPNQQSGNHSR